MATTTAPATPPASPLASAPRNQKERNQLRTRAWHQANEALEQQRAAAVLTPKKDPDVFLMKHVKAARLAAEKTLRMTCNALQTVQSRLDQAKFTAELHILILVVSIPRIEAFENRYDKVERTEYLGNKKPDFFQDKTECYVCEDTKKVPRPVRRAERFEDCYERPPDKKLPLLIEDVEKSDNTKLNL